MHPPDRCLADRGWRRNGWYIQCLDLIVRSGYWCENRLDNFSKPYIFTWIMVQNVIKHIFSHRDLVKSIVKLSSERKHINSEIYIHLPHIPHIHAYIETRGLTLKTGPHGDVCVTLPLSMTERTRGRPQVLWVLWMIFRAWNRSIKHILGLVG